MNPIDTLDSRSLRLTDCYGQRFMREGSYGWAALPSGGGAIDDDRPYTLEVTPRRKDGKMTQHDIQLRWRNRQYVPDHKQLAIEVGDLVVWHCPDAEAPGWEIAGDQAFFGSAALVNECGYSHAFGTPGRYEWVDAHGSNVAGVVHVEPVQCKGADDIARWRKQIAEAALVMVQGGKAQPPEVKVVVGQTVYFAVVAGPGITITDRRLLFRQDDNCAPAPKKAA